jgi:hypothetical protein
VVKTALESPEKTPRELACELTDKEGYFISESSVYRILKAFDLITSPAYIVLSASDKFKNPTKRINELWQTDFTYFRIITWGWYYFACVLDDFSRLYHCLGIIQQHDRYRCTGTPGSGNCHNRG